VRRRDAGETGFGNLGRQAGLNNGIPTNPDPP
jgi:hypothetical protein